MKKIIASFVLLTIVALCSSLAFADANDVSYQASRSAGYSSFQSVACYVTADVTAKRVGSMYGILFDVDVAFTGTDADGFTLTIYEVPILANNYFAWPVSSKIQKFTKTITAATSHYAPESTGINGSIGIGTGFTGGVYITVSGFSGTAVYVNMIFKN
jgi:hypothetical protein